MNDLRFILDDPKKENEEEISKKNKRDFKNDILKVSAGIPSIISSFKEGIKDKTFQSQKWSWTEFNNPARSDNLHLKHWQRVEDIKKDYEYAQYNKKISIVNIKKDEYENLCQNLDPSWTWEETEYLWELCRIYDLRFIVIQDRYNFNTNPIERSVEELKDRYYSVCKRILENRKQFEHPILKSGYCYDQEIKRRACLERIINKNADLLKIENEMLQQIEEINNKTEKIKKFDKFESKNIKQIDDQDKAEGTFEEYIKTRQYINSSFAYLRSYKINHPIPINEKIQKRVDYMLKEMNIPENPIPTERIENGLDVLKNNLIILTSLKKHFEKKNKEKKKLENSLSEIENKINKQKNQNSTVNNVDHINVVEKSMNLIKKEKKKSLGLHGQFSHHSSTLGSSIHAQINNNSTEKSTVNISNSNNNVKMINRKRNLEEESKTEVSNKKKKNKGSIKMSN